MNRDEIKAALLQQIGNIAPEADLSKLDPAVDFREELDIDSIGFLNLVIALAEQLKIPIPEKDYPRLRTIEGALGYLTAATQRIA
jgi:acyl carrier protein